MSLHPTEGARYLFELDSPGSDNRGTADTAAYAVTVYTPESEAQYSARLSIDGDVELAAKTAPVAAPLEKNLAAIAKTIARGARKNIDSNLPPWPRRILRWRGPGRGN